MKIARFLHPDKLSCKFHSLPCVSSFFILFDVVVANLDRYTKEVATEAFIILSQHYEQLKS